MFCYNRSNEKSNRSGFGSDRGQIPGSGPRGEKLTNQKVVLTDDFDRRSVNFENPVYVLIHWRPVLTPPVVALFSV